VRVFGIVLVLLGALILGQRGLGSVAQESRPQAPGSQPGVGPTATAAPALLAGIALTGGLIVLASAGRRDGASD